MSDLALVENVNAVEVFTGGELDDLLKKITDEAKSQAKAIVTAIAKGQVPHIRISY